MKNKIPNDEITALATAAAKLRASSPGHTQWPDEFKSRVVALARDGVSVAELSRVTGIYRSLIDRWRREENGADQLLFAEMAVVEQRRTVLQEAKKGNQILLRTPHGFVATLDVFQMITLAKSGVL